MASFSKQVQSSLVNLGVNGTMGLALFIFFGDKKGISVNSLSQLESKKELPKDL